VLIRILTLNKHHYSRIILTQHFAVPSPAASSPCTLQSERESKSREALGCWERQGVQWDMKVGHRAGCRQVEGRGSRQDLGPTLSTLMVHSLASSHMEGDSEPSTGHGPPSAWVFESVVVLAGNGPDCGWSQDLPNLQDDLGGPLVLKESHQEGRAGDPPSLDQRAWP
jgi:hypothetical protein